MKNRDELNRLWLAAAQEPLGAQLCGRRVPLGRKTNAAPEIATKISQIQRNTKEKMVSTTQIQKSIFSLIIKRDYNQFTKFITLPPSFDY
jgi:hypothetical protein